MLGVSLEKMGLVFCGIWGGFWFLAFSFLASVCVTSSAGC